MDMLLNIFVVILTFCFMEFMAWFMHKYVMHGFMWYFHEDHHQPLPKLFGFFERNDIFFLVFAIPSWLCIMLGLMYGHPIAVSIGAGIAVYGFAYFLVHEVFIHRRLSWFKHSDNIYLRAIRKAHKVHHKKMHKEDGECFGMLIVPFRYFKEAKEAMQKEKSTNHAHA
jgi:beta-carotene 3-hydroxylase